MLMELIQQLLQQGNKSAQRLTQQQQGNFNTTFSWVNFVLTVIGVGVGMFGAALGSFNAANNIASRENDKKIDEILMLLKEQQKNCKKEN